MMFPLAPFLINMNGIIYIPTVKWKKAILMCKVVNSLTPTYLQDLFFPRVSHYRLRDSDGKLYVPKPRTDYLKHSLNYSGAVLWNSLPESLRSCHAITIIIQKILKK